MPLLEFIPDGDGDLFQWAGTPVGQTFLAVQDYDGTDDTSFVGSTVAGNVFLVRSWSIPIVPRVHRVSWVGLAARCRRVATAGPNGDVAPRLRSGVSDFEGPSFGMGAAFQEFSAEAIDGWRAYTDPATGVAWTWLAALAAQAGLVDRTSGAHAVRCSWIRKLVWVEYESRQAACRMWP